MMLSPSPLLIATVLVSLFLSARSEVEVIGAGLGRTGTLSLKEALEDLGYKSYHYVESSHASAWAGLLDESTSVDTVIDLIDNDGYTAVMDNPIADIYLDLHKRYPKAKVILTVRDSPQEFARSWRVLYNTMEVTERPFTPKFPSPFQFVPFFRHLKKLRCFMGTTHLGLADCELLKRWNRHPPEWLEEQYEKHNQHVIDNVPSDQLLVFNVNDGYTPLCQFLGKPIPAGPFPHSSLNSAASLKALRQTFEYVVYAWIPALVALLLIVALCCGCMNWLKAYDEEEVVDKYKLH